MTLAIKEIKLNNYRSYEHLCLSALGQLTILAGPNAVGKTNIIEAIRLLTGISPIRHATTAEYIREGTTRADVSLLAEGDKRSLELGLTITPGAKSYSLNKKHKSSTEMRGIIPSVAFTPDDLTLVKGTGKPKRKALDSLGFQVNSAYAEVYKDFEKIVQQKNKLLKEEYPKQYLQSINEVFVTCASQLFCYRMRLFSLVEPLFEQYYQQISNSEEHAQMRYCSSWGELMANEVPDKQEVIQKIFAALRAREQEEQHRHHAVVGPQSDQITFLINGKDASLYGSQGQQRSIVLAWKLAEVELIHQLLGVHPVLLLDDVMSELDATRRSQLTRFALQAAQTFITTTTLEYLEPLLVSQANIIQLPYVEEVE